jgi:hypothetical protein
VNPQPKEPSAPEAIYGQTVKDCPLAEKKEKTWIAIQLVGEDEKPIPGVAYRIILTDGSTAEGVLDEEGSAHLSGIDPGTCVITFPELDQDAWEEHA